MISGPFRVCGLLEALGFLGSVQAGERAGDLVHHSNFELQSWLGLAV